MPYSSARRNDPRTKEAVLDRMLSYDFDGDIRHLGVEPARLTRTARNRMLLTFPTSGITYELTVRRPRTENPKDETRSFAPKEDEDYLTPEQAKAIKDGQAPKQGRPRKGDDLRVRVQA